MTVAPLAQPDTLQGEELEHPLNPTPSGGEVRGGGGAPRMGGVMVGGPH